MKFQKTQRLMIGIGLVSMILPGCATANYLENKTLNAKNIRRNYEENSSNNVVELVSRVRRLITTLPLLDSQNVSYISNIKKAFPEFVISYNIKSPEYKEIEMRRKGRNDPRYCIYFASLAVYQPKREFSFDALIPPGKCQNLNLSTLDGIYGQPIHLNMGPPSMLSPAQSLSFPSDTEALEYELSRSSGRIISMKIWRSKSLEKILFIAITRKDK